MRIILIPILLLSLNSFAQVSINDELWKIDTSRHIPNGSNTITIEGATFLEVCNAVLDAGFIIDKKDNDLQTLSTVLSKDVWQPIIFVRVKGNTVIFTSGYYQPIGGLQKSFYKENKKNKPWQNAVTNGFMNIYKIAKSFNKPMSFLINNNAFTTQ